MRIIFDSAMALLIICLISWLVGFVIGFIFASLQKIIGTIKVASDGKENYLFLEVEDEKIFEQAVGNEQIARVKIKRV